MGNFQSIILVSSLLVSMSSFAYSPAQKQIMINEMTAAKLMIESSTTRDLERFTVLKNAKGDIIGDAASEKDLSQWALLDAKKDKIQGTSTARLYRNLGDKIKTDGKEVLVAVIDSGVDIHHEDLRGMIWQNTAEINGLPGVDDDGNGYIDDFNGWNFIGNNDGTNLDGSTLEITREYVRLKKKADTGTLTVDEKAYFEFTIRPDFMKRKNDNTTDLKEAKAILSVMKASTAVLNNAGLKMVSVTRLKEFRATDVLTVTAKETMLSLLTRNISVSRLESVVARAEMMDAYYLNTNFNPSDIIGDDPEKMNEIGYGNNDVIAEGADHGTHVSGIIAAIRENSKGIDGQALNVKIMPVRAIPDGDERDKDVANAIRYAVDNGANIINMSFGKPYSPNKQYVDEAIAYAQAKGVLLVHAAGNDGKSTETSANYPSGKGFSSWIEVGASDKYKGLDLPAYFSNYGKTTVDLFAPGMKILSTVPNNGYAAFSGTSMATPEVVGVAALVWSMNRELSAQDVRKILLDTSTKYKKLVVYQPEDSGAKSTKVRFSDLSATGGIVNALKAMKKAL